MPTCTKISVQCSSWLHQQVPISSGGATCQPRNVNARRNLTWTTMEAQLHTHACRSWLMHSMGWNYGSGQARKPADKKQSRKRLRYVRLAHDLVGARSWVKRVQVCNWWPLVHEGQRLCIALHGA
ncbi:hypothetical protein BS78_10G106500 [Paspalum vaginatum]|nr:hypothetical protein BS78_10G106500 [Paspalum vaginatum]